MNYKDIMCDANNLYDGYLKSIKGSKWKEPTQKVMINYLRYIFRIQRQLEDETYTPGPEGEFTLNERGKVRPITSLITQDRIVRHVLCDHVLMPKVEKKLIYDNGASISNKGISFSRKRFEVHLHEYYKEYKSNEGYILFSDFSKFYDNIIHDKAKTELLSLVNNDAYIRGLLDIIFKNFQVDVSYMTDEEFDNCLFTIFNKLDHRLILNNKSTGNKMMEKSVNIGDQLSQIIGVFYPYKIDNYIKYVRSQKYYGRYMDDWYIISPSKEELLDIYEHIKVIATEYGIHINFKKTRIVKLNSTYKYLQIKYTMMETGRIVKRINPKRVTNMRRKLKKLASKVSDGTADYDSVENMFRSWMGSFYKLMSKETRVGLLSLYEELFNKVIIIENKKMYFYDKT